MEFDDILLGSQIEHEDLDVLIGKIKENGGGMPYTELESRTGFSRRKVERLVEVGIEEHKLVLSEKICKRLGTRLITLA